MPSKSRNTESIAERLEKEEGSRFEEREVRRPAMKKLGTFAHRSVAKEYPDPGFATECPLKESSQSIDRRRIGLVTPKLPMIRTGVVARPTELGLRFERSSASARGLRPT